MLFLAWRYGHGEPYRIYNGLDRDYRPLGHPEQPARPPLFPSRLRHFVYGCGLYASELEARLAGAQQTTKLIRGG